MSFDVLQHAEANTRLRTSFPGLDPECGCDCPAEWAALITDLLTALACIPDWNLAYVTQIKSKFGQLRFYYDLPNEVQGISKVIDLAVLVTERRIRELPR